MQYSAAHKIKVTLIRHAQTQGNLEKKYIGKTDEILCDEGIAALKEKIQLNGYPNCDQIFSSPLSRCLETASIIYPGKNIQIIPDLSEIDFGLFEGQNFIDLSDNPLYQKWLASDGKMPFPGGEDREEFIQRSVRGFVQLLNCSRQDAVAIVHGGTIMAVLSYYLKGNYFSYQINNCEGYVCSMIFDEASHEYKMEGAWRI